MWRVGQIPGKAGHIVPKGIDSVRWYHLSLGSVRISLEFMVAFIDI